MKIVTIKPLDVTVTLSLTDCIALYDACKHRGECWDTQTTDPVLLEALGATLLAATLAAADPDMDETRPTIAKVWRVWAPFVHVGHGQYRPMPVPQEYAD